MARNPPSEPRPRADRAPDRASPPGTDRVQARARALGDPTRYGIFRHLVEAPGPVDVPELTARFGLNHNAVRQHLRKLVDAGLVVEEPGPRTGPGRPRLRYRVDPTADARWAAGTASDRLAGILAAAVRSGSTARDAGRQAGIAAAHASGAAASDAITALTDAMVREGFAPEVVARDGGTDVVLHECPFPAAAADAPDVVCAVHLGIAEGIVGALDDTVTVEGLDARDPRVAGCRLRIRRARSG